jgi:regulator of sirC expression with transglutaminase-like and TPR domain
MADPSEIRAAFTSLVNGPEESLDLGRAALLVAAESDPSCDVETCLGTLDAWGEELRGRVQPGWNNLQKLARLRAYMFEHLKFKGDHEDYYSPSNSLLNQVMQRRLGVPLTLSIVFMELGWRVGIPFEGVGFPGHFLVRLTGEPKDLLLDPYSHARSMHEEDCQAILEQIGGGDVPFTPELVAGVSKRDMLVRLLHNLKTAYLRAHDDREALAAVDRLLLLRPGATVEVRDRGLLLYRLGERRAAVVELERYLQLAPQAEDRDAIERHLAELRNFLASLN